MTTDVVSGSKEQHGLALLLWRQNANQVLQI